MIVKIPKNFIPEYTYVLKVLLEENLNFGHFKIETHEAEEVYFITSSGKIVFENVFFKGDQKEFHSLKNLPNECIDFDFENITYKALYFKEKEIKNVGAEYSVGIDIFATTYFLLTQWESTLLEGDHLGRYKYETSTIKKFDLYLIPVVNQYIFLLKNLLQKIGVETKIKEYKPMFSCDIDSITKYKNLRNLLGGFYHRKDYFKIISEYKRSVKNKEQDPYFSFDYMFDRLEKKGIESTFYFMAGLEDSRYDTKDYSLNEPLLQKLIGQIKSKDFTIGLHPTINSWKSKSTIVAQKIELEKACSQSVNDVRQHYLRYNLNTWSIIEESDFTKDSSVQFTQGMGFACGMCTPYSLYNIRERETLKVVETPLILMKKKDYVSNVNATFEEMKSVLDIAKKYNGRFQILFHNSDLETPNEKLLFEKVIDYL